ncbi:hypothetical protein Bsp3421_004646 [Burkholderia sp. FERM BP-3421]|uniref:hypothetical protein n=1 Tax=Burkholderia sp. FERM BP-3421 TaxID=1494466 RepID=UPI002362DA26|nr:hypothetical protein [Burkholderia sp. FERM BP-3421]WDD94518.1 hypothetical protein Bsp3421_004646 [Burkholderia sp. FERM BP-3421]
MVLAIASPVRTTNACKNMAGWFASFDKAHIRLDVRMASGEARIRGQVDAVGRASGLPASTSGS